MLSGRGLCDELITRPEESYRLWCVVVCDLESSKMIVALANWGAVVPNKKICSSGTSAPSVSGSTTFCTNSNTFAVL